MIIRKAKAIDLAELQRLYFNTITNVCNTDYNKEQIEVWRSNIENNQRWQDIISKQFVIVSELNGTITGFCSLDNGNYIDLLFVHKDFQGMGIAQKLYNASEKEAIRQGQTEVTSDVSKTARPFFEKVGFEVKMEQSVNVKGVELTNYKMTKTIG